MASGAELSPLRALADLERAGVACPLSSRQDVLQDMWDLIRGFEPHSIIGRAESRTAAEYSNVMDCERHQGTSSSPLTCPNDRERPRCREFASSGSLAYGINMLASVAPGRTLSNRLKADIYEPIDSVSV